VETPLLVLAIIFIQHVRSGSKVLFNIFDVVSNCSWSSITNTRYLYDFTRSMGYSPIENRGITCGLQWKNMVLVLAAEKKRLSAAAVSR